MSKTEYLLGIDIGSSNVRAVMVQSSLEDDILRVMGAVTLPAEGMRRGVVVAPDLVAQVCTKAIEHAERMSGSPAKNVTVGLSGTEVFCQNALGVVAVARADSEVAEEDVIRVIGEVEARVALPANREIIHVIPKNYRLDDQKNIKDPIGMRGVRLEADAFVIGTSTAQMKGIARIFESVGIVPNAYAVEPIASAEAILNSKQKEIGVVLINIGGSTTSMAVFEEGDLVHLAILPVGGISITNDIAIGLRAPVETAEAVKISYGNALSRDVGKKEDIDLSSIDSHEEGFVSRYHVTEIIEARMEEIFNLVNGELRKVNREGLLPAGAVLCGGGALLSGTVDLAKEILKLPVQVGYPKPLGGILDQVDSPEYATAIGLILLAQERKRVGEIGIVESKIPEWMKRAGEKTKEWARRFLPLD